MPGLVARDGAHIAYQDIGQGPAILLLHGWGYGSMCFAPVIERLAHRFRFVSIEFRGHGRSQGARSGEESIALLADDVDHLVAFLELDNPIVVGWSMGASVLWTWLGDASRRPRAAGAMVVDMSPKIVNDADWRHGLLNYHAEDERRVVASITQNWLSFARLFAPKIFSPEASTKAAAAALEAALDCNCRALAALWRSMTELDARPLLNALTVPTCVVYGARSQLYAPETAQVLVSALPNARLMAFQSSGHAPHLEETEAFAASLATFADDMFNVSAHRASGTARRST